MYILNSVDIDLFGASPLTVSEIRLGREWRTSKSHSDAAQSTSLARRCPLRPGAEEVQESDDDSNYHCGL